MNRSKGKGDDPAHPTRESEAADGRPGPPGHTRDTSRPTPRGRSLPRATVPSAHQRCPGISGLSECSSPEWSAKGGDLPSQGEPARRLAPPDVPGCDPEPDHAFPFAPTSPDFCPRLGDTHPRAISVPPQGHRCAWEKKRAPREILFPLASGHQERIPGCKARVGWQSKWLALGRPGTAAASERLPITRPRLVHRRRRRGHRLRTCIVYQPPPCTLAYRVGLPEARGKRISRRARFFSLAHLFP
jgi:hypothetical protein